MGPCHTLLRRGLQHALTTDRREGGYLLTIYPHVIQTIPRPPACGFAKQYCGGLFNVFDVILKQTILPNNIGSAMVLSMVIHKT
jgi:hypothetical protein